MNIIKHSASKWIIGSLMVASFGLSATALAVTPPTKRSDNARLDWMTQDLNHPVVAYRVLDRNSSSHVVIHVNIKNDNNSLSSSVTINGCSGENNLTLMPGESFECLVKSTAPLTATSNNADTASGFAQFIAKAPK